MADKGPIVIHRLGDEKPVRFAAVELARYLGQMASRKVRVKAAKAYRPETKGVWVGTAEAFPNLVPSRIAHREHPFDDAIFVSAGNGHAVVSGANPRSVVFAAYRYLEDLGCRWLRPGPDGERVPELPAPLSKLVKLEEVAKYRCRCVCIEGSCSEGHVRAMVDYAAKRGFNAYLLQFFNSYHFFKLWYSAERHRGENVTEFSPEEAARICDRIKAELHRRGMIIQRVGHGWTCRPFGIEANEFNPTKEKAPASARKYFAEIKGKRDFLWNTPIFTQLCYSQPKAREMIARAVAEYAQSHRDEEVVHVWLADAANNHCECAACRKTLPSDFYVMILNRIDELLTQRNLPTRIVFAAYLDLLWAPQKERIRNPARFIRMFAPITRSYSTSLLEDGRIEKPMQYVRNKLRFPKSPRANLKLLEGWKRAFTGDTIVFDYYLWRDQFNDPGQTAVAGVIFKDLRDLEKIGMTGFVSCQQTRVSFPTGLPMHVMGKALWGAPESYERMTNDYLTDLFGPKGEAVKRYLETLTKLFDPPFLRYEKRDEASRGKAVKSFAKVPDAVKAFMPTIERGCRSTDKVTVAAWSILREHAWYACALAELYGAIYCRDNLRAVDLYIRYDREVDRRLPRLQHVFTGIQSKQYVRQVLAQEDVPFSFKFIIGEE